MVAIALARLYQRRWSEDILEEARHNFGRHIGPETAQERIDALRNLLPDAMVHDYSEHLAGLANDPKDRHVVAAALESDASKIVTGNLRDFRPLPRGVTAQLPDVFQCGFLEEMDVILAGLERVRTSWPEPWPSHERLLKQLDIFAPQFVNEVCAAL